MRAVHSSTAPDGFPRGTFHKSTACYDKAAPDQAERTLKQALITSQTLDIAHQFGGEENPQAVAALIDLANAKTFQGDLLNAESLLRQGIAIRRKEFSPGHPGVIATEVRLGAGLIAENKAAEAAPLLREAVVSARTAPFPLFPWQLAEVQSALGTCLLALGGREAAD